ncbi:hypothetical protein ACFX15_030857 [Malus domestica]
MNERGTWLFLFHRSQKDGWANFPGRCFDKNPVTTALQPLSQAFLRKKPKGPEDGEPSNQPNRNTTALQ